MIFLFLILQSRNNELSKRRKSERWNKPQKKLQKKRRASKSRRNPTAAEKAIARRKRRVRKANEGGSEISENDNEVVRIPKSMVSEEDRKLLQGIEPVPNAEKVAF